jgi:uncharacterized protein (UPF0248 family)
MTTIKQLLDRIKWDNSFKPEDFRIYYWDNRTKKMMEVRYVDVKEFGSGTFTIDKNGALVEIPLHLIRKVTKAGFVFWARPEKE